MRILLRHIPTGLYFRDLENWTSNPAQAFNFAHLGRALRLVHKARFKEMELVLSADSQSGAGSSMKKAAPLRRAEARRSARNKTPSPASWINGIFQRV
jgi:hypothetical protein